MYVCLTHTLYGFESHHPLRLLLLHINYITLNYKLTIKKKRILGTRINNNDVCITERYYRNRIIRTLYKLIVKSAHKVIIGMKSIFIIYTNIIKNKEMRKILRHKQLTTRPPLLRKKEEKTDDLNGLSVSAVHNGFTVDV